MKKFTILTTIFFIALLTISAIQSSSGPPPERTNAPGEGNCTGCHSGTVNSGPATVNVRVDGGRSDYAPSTTYPVTVSIAESGINRFGFEITALDAANQPAGTITITDATKTRSDQSNGRTYVAHTGSGIDVATPGSQTWSYNWTAPPTSVGTITFYASVMASNRNFSTSGDRIYTRTTALTAIPFALEVIDLSLKTRNNQVVLDWNVSNVKEIDLMALERSIDGKHFTTIKTWGSLELLKQKTDQTDNFSHFDVALNEGIYFYRIRLTEQTGSERLSRIVQATIQSSTSKADFIIEPYYSGESINFYLNNKSSAPMEVSVFDLKGNKVAEETVENQEMHIPADLSQGVYVMKFNNGVSRKIWVWK